MDDIRTKYNELLMKCESEIKETEKKDKRAVRIVLWIKIILAFAGIGAVGAWLQNHTLKELWAGIILMSKIADVMLDTLPYNQQRVKLPQLKLKLVDLFLEIELDLARLDAGELTEHEARDKYYNHRQTWIKSLS